MSDIEYKKLPEDFSHQIKATSDTIKNVLFEEYPKLKELNFSHLQFNTVDFDGAASTVTGYISVKPNSQTIYRLNKYHHFKLPRIGLDYFLTQLGLVDRTFPKEQYPEMKSLLASLGTFTPLDDEFATTTEDVRFAYTFGTPIETDVTIDLGDSRRNKNQLGLLVKDAVIFTFTSKPVIKDKEEVPEAETPSEEEETPAIDIAKFFKQPKTKIDLLK